MSATITETIDVEAPPAGAFAHVANLGNLDQWDPTFDHAVRTNTGPLGTPMFKVVGTLSASGMRDALSPDDEDA